GGFPEGGGAGRPGAAAPSVAPARTPGGEPGTGVKAAAAAAS
ncbi:hypothetical protein GA0115247_11621, partial [Streptomyces sp. PalvLS-984]